MLYTPDSARQLPNAINRELSGDSSGFARAPAEIRQTWQRALAIGVFFSVTCSEDIPFVNEPERSAISSRTLGEFRRREQMKVCQDWPRAKITKNFGKPFRTAVPTLLFSGALDPVTPPSAGEEALKFPSKGRHFVLPENGHPMGERAACIAETMEALLETRSVQDVANHCTGSQQ
jgi:pimeloyl-ACP methyl ester carboxylesterase